jgi:pimeloyl-ACP methyl ester carboxylesterase
MPNSQPNPDSALAAFTSRTIEALEGRTIGFAEYGSTSPEARVLIFFHGLPGSRVITVPHLQERCEKKNVRLIAIDRPGIGLTSPIPDEESTFDRSPSDTMVVLGELDIDVTNTKIGLIGYSMGGPHAIKFAQDSPELVDHVHLVAPASFYVEPENYKISPEWSEFLKSHINDERPMMFGNRIANMLNRWAPWTTKEVSPFLAPRKIDADSYVKNLLNSTSPTDKAALTPEDCELWDLTASETFRQGTEGMIKAGLETAGKYSPSGWGWDVSKFPTYVEEQKSEGIDVHFYAANTDCLMPLNAVVDLADTIGASPENFHVYETGIGHLALVRDALNDIVEKEGSA